MLAHRADIYIYIFLRKQDALFRLFNGFERNLSRKVSYFVAKRSREGGLVTNAPDRMRSDTVSNRRSQINTKISKCTFASMIKDVLISILLLAKTNLKNALISRDNAGSKKHDGFQGSI